MGEQTFEDLQNCLDGAWQDAEAIMRRLQALKPTDPRDAMQIGKAIAAVAIAGDAMKQAAGTLGRTSTTMWTS